MLLQGSENYRSWEKNHKTQWGGRGVGRRKNQSKSPKSKLHSKQHRQHEFVPGLFSSWIFFFHKSRTSERTSQKQTYSPVIVCRNGPRLIHLTWISARSKYIWKIKKNYPGGVLQPKEATILKLILEPKLFYWFQLTTVLYRQENWSRKDLKAAERT